MKIYPGEYLTRSGDIITVSPNYKSDLFSFSGSNGLTYTAEGSHLFLAESKDDLVSRCDDNDHVTIDEPEVSLLESVIINELSCSDIVWPKYGCDTIVNLARRIVKKAQEVSRSS